MRGNHQVLVATKTFGLSDHALEEFLATFTERAAGDGNNLMVCFQDAGVRTVHTTYVQGHAS